MSILNLSDRRIIKRIILPLSLAFFIVSSDIITFEYLCDYPERGPKFYGFPFVKSTDRTWVFSMSGTIYLLGFIGNLLFWSLLFAGLFYPFSKIRHRITRRILGYLGCFMFSIASFISFMNLTIIDWNIKWSHDNFKMNYYQSDIECERTFRWNGS